MTQDRASAVAALIIKTFVGQDWRIASVTSDEVEDTDRVIIHLQGDGVYVAVTIEDLTEAP